MQIYRKYGMRVKVAVCEQRRKGIEELRRLFPDLQMIVLDDSFQHRCLPGASDSNIPDSHYRNIEFFLRQDTPVEHPIADTRHASIV